MRSRNAETGDITITRDGVDFTLNAGDITFVLDCQRMARFERISTAHGLHATVRRLDNAPAEEDTP